MIALENQDYKQIGQYLKQNKIVIGMTDTIYGFMWPTNQPELTKKVLVAKKRAAQKKFLVLINNLDQINPKLLQNSLVERLIKLFWPGYLTLLVSDQNQETFAFRMVAKDSFCSQLINECKSTLHTTSCNLASEQPLHKYDAIYQQFKDLDDNFVLVKYPNEQQNKNQLPSTIIEIKEDQMVLIRDGLIPYQTILTKLNQK